MTTDTRRTSDTRRTIVKSATVFVIIFAYGFSYSHGVAWALEHLPEDQPGRELYAYGLAAIPEVCFVMAVLRAQENPRDARVWVIGALSFGWMLWTNGAASAGGTSGMVVALLAPTAALLMLWVNGHPTPEKSGPVMETATRVTVERATRPAPVQPRPTVTATVVQPRPTVTQKAITPRSSDQLAAGVDWIKAQPGFGPAWTEKDLPSRPSIADGAGISDSTAKRARATVREELGL